MHDAEGRDCVVNSSGDRYQTKQGYPHHSGISSGTAGARGICMHRVAIPPGGRERAHLHRGHETAIYIVSGRAEMYYGERLERHLEVRAGEFLYIPPDVPHLPYNPSDREPCICIISRTDADEQESVVLLPELERRYHPDA